MLHILEDATYVSIHLRQHMFAKQDCSSFPLDFSRSFHLIQYWGIYQLLVRMWYEGKWQKEIYFNTSACSTKQFHLGRFITE